MSGMEFVMISFHSPLSRVSSSPLCCAVVSCFSPHPSPAHLILFLQFHLMMRLTEMMNNLRLCVVNHIHIHTLRHTGNHISSRIDIVSMRAPDDRSGVKFHQGPRSNSFNLFRSRSMRGDEQPKTCPEIPDPRCTGLMRECNTD